MAKDKKAEPKKMPAVASQKDTKPVRLDMPLALHKALSVEAGYRGLSLAALARLYVEQGIRADKEDRIRRGEI